MADLSHPPTNNSDIFEPRIPGLSGPPGLIDRQTGKKSEKGPNHKVAFAMAGIALAIVAAVGIGNAVNAYQDKEPPTPIKNEAIVSEPTTDTIAAEITNTAKKTEEARVDSYEAGMKKFKEESVTDFESRPRDERLAYAQFLTDQIVSRGNYALSYGPDTPGAEYAIKYKPASKGDDGQEILDNHLYGCQISCLQLIEGVGGDDYDSKPFDKSDGAKALSAAFYEVGDNNPNTSTGYTTGKSGEETKQMAYSISDKLIATDVSELKTGIDSAGKRVSYKDVVQQGDKESTSVYSRFVYHEFTSYDNTRKANWLNVANADTQDQLETRSSVKP